MSQNKPLIVAYQVITKIVRRSDFDHYKSFEKVSVDDEAFILDLITKHDRNDNGCMEVSHRSLNKLANDVWEATIEAIVLDQDDLKDLAISAVEDNWAEGEVLDTKLEWIEDGTVTHLVAEVVTVSNDTNFFCHGIEIGDIYTVKPTHTSFPKFSLDEDSSPSP